jgi:hypothetical protein
MPEVPGNPSRYVVTATMSDVPHLTAEAREAILKSTPLHQRNARETGVPSLGAGKIYPIDEELITVKDFDIPAWYPRAYGMDTGFKATAAAWIAYNLETGIGYIYDTYKRGGPAGGTGYDDPAMVDNTEPILHAEAIKARGDWMQGVADAAAIRPTDGKQYLHIYQNLGLKLELPDKRSLEANILAVWTALTNGKLKIFKSCLAWFDEYRIYRRDENGQVVHANDHIMNATQYIVKAGLRVAKIKPVQQQPYVPQLASSWT